MKKSIVVLLHIGFWLCYFVLIFVILGVLYGDDGMTSESKIEKSFKSILCFAVVPSVITFYAFYLFLFPRYLQRQRILLLILFGVVISIGSAIIGYFLLDLLILSSPQDINCMEKEGSKTYIAFIIFMSFVTLISGIIALVIKGFITWFEETKLREILKQQNHDMELALVKSQLDPHFLFNTINNIDVLILKNPENASNYLNKLSDIMRFMLFETKPEKILLSKELEYIEKYIELQKIRTANTSYVSFVIQGNPAEKTIAPMVFIPFIENAFKHTTNKKLENAIEVTIVITNKSIQLICQNKFDVNRTLKNEKSGLGNGLILKRLQLIYPEKHQLDVSNQDGIYRVSLTIKHG